MFWRDPLIERGGIGLGLLGTLELLKKLHRLFFKLI